MTRLLIALCSLCIFCNLSGQQICLDALGSSGSDGSGSGISLAWTVGEMAVATFSIPANVLTQGFHQDEYCGTPIVSREAQLSSVEASCIEILRNPFRDRIVLDANCSSMESVSCRIVDVNGKILYEITLDLEQTRNVIPAEGLANGMYFLTLENPNWNYLQNFKLIKSN